MFASALAGIQESNKTLQDKVDSSNKELKQSNTESKEGNKTLQDKVESSNKELREINNTLQKDIEDELKKLQENVKADVKLETENLFHRFQRENHKLNKQFTEKVKF
jgi:F0F1-type ATP synthase membrane subunit b/b'